MDSVSSISSALPSQQRAGRAEEIDETESIPSYIVVLVCILFGIGNEEAATYVLNIERSEAGGNLVVFECSVPSLVIVAISVATTHLVEVGVVNLDLTCTKISDVKAAVSVQFS